MDYHPFLVHFPISLFFTAFIFEILRYKIEWIHEKIPLLIFIFATVFSIFSSLTGNSEKLLIVDISGVLNLLENHESMGTSVTIFGIFFSFFLVFIKLKFPTKNFSKLKISVFFLVTLMVFYTAFLGGKLAHDFGIYLKNELELKD